MYCVRSQNTIADCLHETNLPLLCTHVRKPHTKRCAHKTLSAWYCNSIFLHAQEVRFVDLDDSAVAALNEEIELQKPAPTPSLSATPQHSVAKQTALPIQVLLVFACIQYTCKLLTNAVRSCMKTRLT